jgi:Initiator Replication protein
VKKGMTKVSSKKASPDSAFQLSMTTVEEQGILESFFKLPQTERKIIRQLLEKCGPQQVGVVRLPVPFSSKEFKERRNLLLPVYKLIRYHRLTFDSIADGALRSTYLPWIESITHVKAGGEEELEVRLNSNYEKVWRALKQRLEEPSVRLKSQYSTRLYQWAKPYVAVGYKRVSLATLRKVLGLEEIKDNSGSTA